jgi:N12 class adenine-specific DNA methylase
MSRRGWQNFNPMAEPMFQAMAESIVLEHAQKVKDATAALAYMAAKYPQWATSCRHAAEAIAKAYEKRDLPMLNKALEQQRKLTALAEQAVEVEPCELSD